MMRFAGRWHNRSGHQTEMDSLDDEEYEFLPSKLSYSTIFFIFCNIKGTPFSASYIYEIETTGVRFLMNLLSKLHVYSFLCKTIAC